MYSLHSSIPHSCGAPFVAQYLKIKKILVRGNSAWGAAKIVPRKLAKKFDGIQRNPYWRLPAVRRKCQTHGNMFLQKDLTKFSYSKASLSEG